MSEQTVTLPSENRRPVAIASQATAIEQQRAIAEVQAAVVVAQQCPRDVSTSIENMRDSCHQQALAGRAFFRYPRAGSQITGPSIHLARELARVWGNIQYGIAELHRDTTEGHSEMVAFAWDVQTNTRSSSTFIVPHKKDTKSGVKDLTDLRDVYENNANQGARRVREAIFNVLPAWFTEEAKTLCMATLENGGDKPLAQRITDAVAWFGTKGVKPVQLEDKVGAKRGDWSGVEVAQLEVIARSVMNGEALVDEEFPKARTTAAEVTGKAQRTTEDAES